MPDTRDDELPVLRQPFTRAERWVLAAFAVVAGLGVTSAVRGHLKEERLRADLLARQATERAALPPRSAHVVDDLDRFATDLASPIYAGDVADPALREPGAAARLFAQGGLYFRLPQAQGGSVDEVHGAARRSRKDALASCLMSSVAPEPADAPSTCAEGSGCIGDASGRLTNVRVLHRGLRPMSDTFASDVRGALDGMRLAVLQAELDDRTPDEVETAKTAAEGAAYALLVVDETPAGFEAPPNQPLSTSLETIPHVARIEVVALPEGKPVLRLRRPVDAALGPTSEESAVRRQVQNCALGLEAVRTLTASR